MKRLLAIFLLAQLASAGWFENLTVYSFDAMGRPLPGTMVEVRYQRENYPIIGGGYDGVATGYTDENGIFDVILYNQVLSDAGIKWEYVIFVNFQGKTDSRTVKCPRVAGNCSDGRQRQEYFTLPAYQALVRTSDLQGNAVPGAFVSIGSSLRYTNSNGEAGVELADGSSYDVIVNYGELVARASGRVAGKDAVHEVTLPLHSIQLKVIEDKGFPLEGVRVKIGNDSQYTDASGAVKFEKLALSNATAEVRLTDRMKVVSFNLTQDVFQTIVFDLTPPSLSPPRLEKAGENVAVVVDVLDTGAASTGLRSSRPLVLNYSADGKAWTQAEMHVVSAGTFAATLPVSLYPNATFRYEIHAFDNDGNEAMAAGNFSALQAQPPSPIEGIGGGSYLWVLGAIIIVIVVVMIFKKIREEY